MIYLITCAETNCCKIGYSSNPEKRLGQLQTANSYKLTLIKTINGDLKLETDLHNKFRNYRLQGEWFEFTEEINNFFTNYMELPINIEVDTALIEKHLYKQGILWYLKGNGGKNQVIHKIVNPNISKKKYELNKKYFKLLDILESPKLKDLKNVFNTEFS